jgi:hypothetical protein
MMRTAPLAKRGTAMTAGTVADADRAVGAGWSPAAMAGGIRTFTVEGAETDLRRPRGSGCSTRSRAPNAHRR